MTEWAVLCNYGRIHVQLHLEKYLIAGIASDPLSRPMAEFNSAIMISGSISIETTGTGKLVVVPTQVDIRSIPKRRKEFKNLPIFESALGKD